MKCPNILVVELLLAHESNISFSPQPEPLSPDLVLADAKAFLSTTPNTGIEQHPVSLAKD